MDRRKQQLLNKTREGRVVMVMLRLSHLKLLLPVGDRYLIGTISYCGNYRIPEITTTYELRVTGFYQKRNWFKDICPLTQS